MDLLLFVDSEMQINQSSIQPYSLNFVFNCKRENIFYKSCNKLVFIAYMYVHSS